MKSLNAIVFFLLVLGTSIVSAGTKSPAILLQEGLYAEETEGDLDKAIKLYQQVVAESAEIERIGAQATYQLDMCYLKKSNKEKAAEYFKLVISNYSAQKAIVKKANQQLEKINPSMQQVIETAVKTISNCAEGDPRVTEALKSFASFNDDVVVAAITKYLDSETDNIRRSAIFILKPPAK